MLDAVLLVQRRWRRRASRRMGVATATLRGMVTCAVCHDECVRLVRCSNGHACCVGCAMCATDTRCPLCRENRPLVPDTTVLPLLEACGTRLQCASCRTSLVPRQVEKHRAWCAEHRFLCPWSNCSQCVHALSMADHVRGHPNVPALTRRLDGGYHLVVALLSRVSESIVCCVEDATIVISNGAQRIAVFGSPKEPPMMLTLRAYYASGTSRALRATVRQHMVSSCDQKDAWVDEHRVGVISPMIASREAVVSTSTVAALTPRTLIVDSMVMHTPHIMLPDARPGHTPGLGDRIRRNGMRDLPPAMLPMNAVADAHTPAALVHICIRDDPTPISDVYDG